MGRNIDVAKSIRGFSAEVAIAVFRINHDINLMKMYNLNKRTYYISKILKNWLIVAQDL
jgi:hypothetical protein